MNSGTELVSRIYAAFASGDVMGLLGHLDPDVVWNEAEGNSLADGNPYRGPEAIVAGVFMRLMAEWKDFSVVVDEIVGGDEVVTMFGRYRGTHTESGKPLDVQAAHTWWIENGKIVRFQQMVDTAGLAAASQK
ncbi:SnoaL-like domain protein [Planctomycetes bacterium Poly30]|uniref:SnoaL-like domain protein n=1 Tax=Saltatorellus ferox TaxID=2528018 RepID=A0A518F0M7_9BACT|nr:SnoaL-like domain protein [Planctomycetes bacterium Poly30]